MNFEYFGTKNTSRQQIKMNIIKNYLVLIIFIQFNILKAQDYGGNKTEIGNFIRRIYNTQSFSGVKVLQSQEGLNYMISVVELKKDPSWSGSVLNRIANVKAKAYASQYINGVNIRTELIFMSKTVNNFDSSIIKNDTQEILKESSLGFVDGMELLTNFESNDGKQVVFIYYKEIKK